MHAEVGEVGAVSQQSLHGVGDDDRPGERLGQLRCAGGLDHGAAHQREFQAVRRADIAEHDIPEMHADAEGDLVGPRPVAGHHRGQPPACIRGGVQRLPAGLGRVRPVEHGEDAEHGVTQDVEHLPAAILHRAGRTLEVGVEHRQELVERQAIRQSRRVAHVAVPDGRGEPLAAAAPDGAAEDALADQRAVIRLQRRSRDLAVDRDAQRQCQRPHQPAEGILLVLAEPLRACGERAQDSVRVVRDGVGGEVDGQREIVPQALLAQFVEDREGLRLVRVQPGPQLGQAVVQHVVVRAFLERLGRQPPAGVVAGQQPRLFGVGQRHPVEERDAAGGTPPGTGRAAARPRACAAQCPRPAPRARDRTGQPRRSRTRRTGARPPARRGGSGSRPRDRGRGLPRPVRRSSSFQGPAPQDACGVP